MRLAEQKRPRSLGEIIGQPAVTVLRSWAKQPYACSWLLEGPPGTGKTSAAGCIVNALDVDPQVDVHTIGCANLTIGTIRQLMAGARCRPMFSRWRILIFEEFEQLTQAVQMSLKVDLDPVNLPPHLVTIATSNDVSRIPPAVRQRFGRLQFTAGADFARQAAAQLHEHWTSQRGTEPPEDYVRWGWDGARYSLRAAWDKMEVALMLSQPDALVA